MRMFRKQKMHIFLNKWLCNEILFRWVRLKKVRGPFLALMAFKGQSFFIKWKLGSKWPHDLNLVKVWWVAAEKIEPKAESCFEGHRPWNEFFWTFFFKFLQLWKWAIWMYGKIFKQRPKGRSPGLYMAFLALKIYSSSMMNRNSCSFQISTKSD